MARYEVTYEILTEARTDSFLGSGSSNLQNLKMVVEANGPNQASEMVQSMNGGYSRCRVTRAFPV